MLQHYLLNFRVIRLIVRLWVTTNKFSIQTGFLDLKEGVAGGNTPPKVYLVALERLRGNLREKFRSVAEVCIENYDLPKINLNMKAS